MKILLHKGIKEIGQAINHSPNETRKMIKDEGLPAWRRTNDSVWYARPEDLERWVEEQAKKFLQAC